jgi:hypothetical protein
MDPVTIDHPWEMHRLFLEVEAGDVALDSLEAPLAAELAEYRQQLLEAERDTVEERIEAMLRQRLQEEGLPCGLVELPAAEASTDNSATAVDEFGYKFPGDGCSQE